MYSDTSPTHITKRIKGIIREEPLTEQAILRRFSWILFGFGVFLGILILMYATNVRGEGVLVVFAIMPIAIGLIFIKAWSSRKGEEDGSTREG